MILNGYHTLLFLISIKSFNIIFIYFVLLNFAFNIQFVIVLFNHHFKDLIHSDFMKNHLNIYSFQEVMQILINRCLRYYHQ